MGRVEKLYSHRVIIILEYWLRIFFITKTIIFSYFKKQRNQKCQQCQIDIESENLCVVIGSSCYDYYIDQDGVFYLIETPVNDFL